MPTLHTITVTTLTDLVFTLASDGGLTISYTGQTTITQAPSTYYKWYTYGILGNSLTPLVFVSVTCAAPSHLKTESYINNSHLAISLGVDGSSKYAIIGNGDIRPQATLTAIDISLDNQSLNGSSSSYPNYTIVAASGTGAGASLTFYHP